MCLLFLTVSMAVMSTVSAQSSCTDVLISMAPCLGYITGNSSSPSQQCCSQLAHVIRSSGECLCEVLKGGGPHLGINFNKTQALALPKACNVQTPPVSRCNGKNNLCFEGIIFYQTDHFLSLTHQEVVIFQMILLLNRLQDHPTLQVQG